ncbi:flagellar hook-associated protein 3 [Bacillus cereus]|uniref:Flagellar hook-associated protein FlgL n=1 Tax=Bacillus cereus TaxID=1396 RepID=A0A164QRX6_BACCE|nr:flagellar hook-associated protein FlgL [Bacillus cereus]KZD72096.1 Flagellar hook-associated protein FlgL [Bacillus cereus]HDR8321120.1 flagellar hook-associated protein FlgL [Bacillus cereus]HDR8327291.1 flagellar hook-associated protein FlgL [Bacillus cereus]HDR8332993.1 flagellar hook-associated protein FlgL [Bacillus cereus]
MRVTTYGRFMMDQYNLNKLQEKTVRQQTQLATGKEFLQISENPIGANQVMLIDQAKAQIGQYQKNISDADSAVSNMESSLASIVELYQSVRDDGLRASSDTFTAEERQTFAKTIDESLKTMLGIANGKHLGRYVFSGQSIQTEPFVYDGTKVTYQGSADEMKTVVAPSMTVPSTKDGGKMFQAAFDSLVKLKDAVASNSGDDIRTALGDLDSKFQTVIDARSELGVHMKSMKDLDDMYNTENVSLEVKKSNAQDVDVPEVMMEFMKTQNMQQALVMSMNKMMDNSLLNFFR